MSSEFKGWHHHQPPSQATNPVADDAISERVPSANDRYDHDDSNPKITGTPKLLHEESSAATLRVPDDGGESGAVVREKTKDAVDVAEEEEDLEEARERLSLQGDMEDIIYVDWDGPDDPDNPRKCVSSRKSVHSLLNSDLCAAGRLSRSGPSRSSSPSTPGSVHLLRQ